MTDEDTDAFEASIDEQDDDGAAATDQATDEEAVSTGTGEDDAVADDESGAAADRVPPADGTQVIAYLQYGTILVLVVLAVVATMQFYSSTQAAIARLASDQFRPLFRAVFNLVVLLVAGVGIAQVVRRMG